MAQLPWNGPLFPVKGRLAARYAQALKHVLGLECPLTSFSVDRAGWSPQLAATLGADYLGAGALRHAIILSPDQASAPPVRRRFSYEAPALEMVYLRARATLLTLIEHEAVIVELDTSHPFCRSAVDLLAVSGVEACFSTPNDTLGKTQRLLELAAGLREKARLLDNAYIEQMLAMVKDVGDPRQRALPDPLRLPVESVWAEIGGGVYVLRRLDKEERRYPVVITAQPDAGVQALEVTALTLDDPALVDLLHGLEWLKYNVTEELLRRRLTEMEVDALLAADEPAPATSDSERRRQLARHPNVQELLPPIYWELDTLLKHWGPHAFNPGKLSAAAKWALAQPAAAADVVGHLVARFTPFDYATFTHHHRWTVEQEWPGYSAAKRRYLAEKFPYLTASFIAASSEAPGAEPSSADEAGAQPA